MVLSIAPAAEKTGFDVWDCERNERAWVDGIVWLPDGGAFVFSAKVFPEPSSFGHKRGQISKLTLYCPHREKTVFEWDRGPVLRGDRRARSAADYLSTVWAPGLFTTGEGGEGG